MQYRFLLNVGDFPHCIWIDNSIKLSRHSPLGQAEMSGLLDTNFRGDLILVPRVMQWLNTTFPGGFKLNGHSRTGMAVLFSDKAAAMLFKLAHEGG